MPSLPLPVPVTHADGAVRIVVDHGGTVCCAAVNADCEACKAGETLVAYCAKKPLMTGCEAYTTKATTKATDAPTDEPTVKPTIKPTIKPTEASEKCERQCPVQGRGRRPHMLSTPGGSDDKCKSIACAATECMTAGTCNPATGSCSTQKRKPDGTACSDDGNTKTADTCKSGVCTHVAINTPGSGEDYV